MNRKQVVEACCYLNEAERSLHHVLNPACHWADFVAYYVPEKVAALKQLARTFQPGAPAIQRDFPTVEELLEWYRAPGILHSIFGFCIGPFQSCWRIPADEASFVASVFDAMMQLLSVRDKPDDHRLIAARMTTLAAHRIIEERCLGLRELNNVRKVGWFNQLPHQPTLTVTDILRDVA